MGGGVDDAAGAVVNALPSGGFRAGDTRWDTEVLTRLGGVLRDVGRDPLRGQLRVVVLGGGRSDGADVDLGAEPQPAADIAGCGRWHVPGGLRGRRGDDLSQLGHVEVDLRCGVGVGGGGRAVEAEDRVEVDDAAALELRHLRIRPLRMVS